jgi:hypothetical protein
VAYFAVDANGRYVGLGAAYASDGMIRTGEDTAWYGLNTTPANCHVIGIANDNIHVGDLDVCPVVKLRAKTGGTVAVEIGAGPIEALRFINDRIRFSANVDATRLIDFVQHGSSHGNTLRIVGQKGATGAFNGGDVEVRPGDDGGSGIDGKLFLQSAAGVSRIGIDTGNGIGFFTKAATPVAQQSVSAALTNSTGGSGGTVIGDAGTGADYGEIYAEGNATGTTLTGGGTWDQILIFDTDGASSGATPDHTNDHITVGTTGVYFVGVSITFTPTGTDTFAFEVKKNNNGTAFPGLHGERRAALNDVGSVSISGFASLTAADTVELWALNTTGTSNITVTDVNLSIHRVDHGADADVINNNFTRTLTRINELRAGNVALGLFA